MVDSAVAQRDIRDVVEHSEQPGGCSALDGEVAGTGRQIDDIFGPVGSDEIVGGNAGEVPRVVALARDEEFDCFADIGMIGAQPQRYLLGLPGELRRDDPVGTGAVDAEESEALVA